MVLPPLFALISSFRLKSRILLRAEYSVECFPKNGFGKFRAELNLLRNFV